MVPDEAHARASEFGRMPRSTLDAAWASRGRGYLGTLPGPLAAYSDNEPLCALLRTKMKYYIVEGDPNCFWTVKKALQAVVDSKYEITAANYYKIYKKGIPEGGVVDRFLEEYFGPVPCGGAWC